MLHRLGSALVLIGIIILVVFLVTGSIGQGDMRLLLAGAALSLLGLRLRRRPPEEDQEPRRFRAIRRMLGDETESEED